MPRPPRLVFLWFTPLWLISRSLNLKGPKGLHIIYLLVSASVLSNKNSNFFYFSSKSIPQPQSQYVGRHIDFSSWDHMIRVMLKMFFEIVFNRYTRNLLIIIAMQWFMKWQLFVLQRTLFIYMCEFVDFCFLVKSKYNM